MQVQISESTKKALDTIDAGLFNLKSNKEVDVKVEHRTRHQHTHIHLTGELKTEDVLRGGQERRATFA